MKIKHNIRWADVFSSLVSFSKRETEEVVAEENGQPYLTSNLKHSYCKTIHFKVYR